MLHLFWGLGSTGAQIWALQPSPPGWEVGDSLQTLSLAACRDTWIHAVPAPFQHPCGLCLCRTLSAHFHLSGHFRSGLEALLATSSLQLCPGAWSWLWAGPVACTSSSVSPFRCWAHCIPAPPHTTLPLHSCSGLLSSTMPLTARHVPACLAQVGQPC